jgi:hypothetical protein
MNQTVAKTGHEQKRPSDYEPNCTVLAVPDWRRIFQGFVSPDVVPKLFLTFGPNRTHHIHHSTRRGRYLHATVTLQGLVQTAKRPQLGSRVSRTRLRTGNFNTVMRNRQLHARG